MNLTGEWSDSVNYGKGDVARYSSGVFYIALKPVPAGVPCADALYWNPLPSPFAECAKMIMDIQATLASAIGEVAESIPTNISDEAITLKTETADYLITVDDSGETPELEVTAIEEEADEGADT